VEIVREAGTLQEAAAAVWALLDEGEALARVLAEDLTLGHLMGVALAAETPGEAHLALAVKLDAQRRWSDLPPRDAVDFWRRRARMLPEDLAKVEDRYRSRAFGASMLGTWHLVDTAYEAIGDAIAQGTTVREFLDRMEAAGAKRSARLATVFQTEVGRAYAAGRWAQMTDPDVLARRPYWQYLTEDDERVRPAHRAMHRRIYPATDAIWQHWYPPNGYRCRCEVISLTEAEAKAAGIAEGAPKLGDGMLARPDKYFDGSPATALLAEDVAGEIRGTVARSGALRGSAAKLAQRAKFSAVPAARSSP